MLSRALKVFRITQETAAMFLTNCRNSTGSERERDTARESERDPETERESHSPSPHTEKDRQTDRLTD